MSDGQISFTLDLDVTDWEAGLDNAVTSARAAKQRLQAIARGDSASNPDELMNSINNNLKNQSEIIKENLRKIEESKKKINQIKVGNSETGVGPLPHGEAKEGDSEEVRMFRKENNELLAESQRIINKLQKENEKIVKEYVEINTLIDEINKAEDENISKQKIKAAIVRDFFQDLQRIDTVFNSSSDFGRKLKPLPHEDPTLSNNREHELDLFDVRLKDQVKLSNIQEKIADNERELERLREKGNRKIDEQIKKVEALERAEQRRKEGYVDVLELMGDSARSIDKVVNSGADVFANKGKSDILIEKSKGMSGKADLDQFDLKMSGKAGSKAREIADATKELERMQRIIVGTATKWDKFIEGGRKAYFTLKDIKDVGVAGLGKVVGAIDAASFASWKLQSALHLLTNSVQGLSNMAKAGEEVAKVQFSFESMTRGAGVSLDKLRAATQNVVDDKTLMQLANFGAQAKMTGKDIELLAERAMAASFVTGKTTDEMFRRMVEGIAKQEKEVLDEATVRMPNAAKIWAATAKQMGKSLDDLTPDDKTKAYFDAFVKSSEHLGKVAKNLPQGLTETSKAQASFTNQMDRLNKSFNDTLAKSGALDALSGVLEKVFSSMDNMTQTGATGDLLNDISDAIGAILGVASDLSPVLFVANDAFGSIVDVIVGLRPLISLLSTGLTAILVPALKMVQITVGGVLWGLGELLELIPVIGDEFRAMSSAGEEIVDSALKMDNAFSKKLTPALKSTQGELIRIGDTVVEINPSFQTAITNANDFASALMGLDIQARSAAAGISSATMSMQVDIEKMSKAIDILRKGPQALAEAGAAKQVMEGALAQQRQAELTKARAEKAANYYHNLQNGSWGEAKLKPFMDEQGVITEGEMLSLFKQAEIQERAAADALVKLKDQADKFGADSGFAMTKAFSEAYLESTTINIPMLQKAGAVALDMVGNVVNPLGNGKLPVIDEYLNEKDKKILVDAMSVKAEAVERPDLFKGLDRFNPEAVKGNIKALDQYAGAMKDDYAKVEREINDIVRMEKEIKETINNTSQLMGAQGLTVAQLKAIRGEPILPGDEKPISADERLEKEQTEQIRVAREAKEQQLAMLKKRIDDAEEMKGELGKRLKPPSGGGGGKKEKSAKMILPELIDVTNQFMEQANMVTTGEAAYVSASFGARLSTEQGGAIVRGYRDDIQNWLPQIEEMGRNAIFMVDEAMAKAVNSTDMESFEKYKKAAEGVMMAVEQGGALEYSKDAEKIRATFNSTKDQLRYTAEQWEANAEITKLAATNAEAARDAQLALNMAKAEYEANARQYQIDATMTRDQYLMEQPDAMKAQYSDVPEYIKQKHINPLMKYVLDDLDRKKEEINRAAEEEQKTLAEYFRTAGAIGGLSDFIAGKASIEERRKREQAAIDLQKKSVIEKPNKEATKEYADKYSEVMDTFQNNMTKSIAHDMTYTLSDALFVSFNSALTITGDWTEDMMQMVEGMTQNIGDNLAQMGTGLVKTMGGGELLAGVTGGVIGGFWKGLMSIFRRKDQRDDAEARMRERELRRKETVKDVSLSVVVNNNGLPVNAQTAQQVADNIEYDMRRGGKLSRLIYGGG